MKTANINRFIQLIHEAFGALGAQVPMQQVEQMAMQVHSAMESPRRRYHRSEHALALCKGVSPVQVLAAVFHDVVYYQLDGGFSPRVAHHLKPLVGLQGNDLVLRTCPQDDCAMQMCLDVFGFKAGQTLPLFRGMNEFLSAAVAVRMLQPYLGLADLLTVVACIEATIPFRGPDADGQECMPALAQRVARQAQQQLGLEPGAALQAFVDKTMAAAVDLANRDVGSFSVSHHGKFLSGTWLLIEESNAPLAAVGVYTLQDYREALTRMLNFLSGLQASRVFHDYPGVTSEAQYQALSQAAASNIAFSVAFLRLKIVAILVIEALALDTGGNCPVSMFLGDIRSSGGDPERVEDYLPAGPESPRLDAHMLHILEVGRPEDASNDLAESPLTAYIYRCLGPEGSAEALEEGKRMLAGQITPRGFLQTLPVSMVHTVIDACQHIAFSRREALLSLRQALAA